MIQTTVICQIPHNMNMQEARQASTSKHPSPGRRVDVDATVNDLLTNVKNLAPKNNPTESVQLEIFWKLLKMT